MININGYFEINQFQLELLEAIFLTPRIRLCWICYMLKRLWLGNIMHVGLPVNKILCVHRYLSGVIDRAQEKKVMEAYRLTLETNWKLDYWAERATSYSQQNRNKLAFSMKIRITYTVKMHKATLWTKCPLKCDISFPLKVKWNSILLVL